MRTRLFRVIPLCTLMVVTGCTNYGRQEQAGMVIGGALGGLLGAQYDHGHDDADDGERLDDRNGENNQSGPIRVRTDPGQQLFE